MLDAKPVRVDNADRWHAVVRIAVGILVERFGPNAVTPREVTRLLTANGIYRQHDWPTVAELLSERT